MSLRQRGPRSLAVALVALLGLWLAALANAQASVATCPPTSTSAQSTPTPNGAQPSPEQVIACIGSIPISAATFTHWSAIARKYEGASSKHAPATATEVVSEVMGFLISSDWVLAEAREQGIVVSEAVVRRAFDRISHQQFPRRGEFKKFLRQTGETVADLLLRIRLNLLSQRIQSEVVAGHHGERARQQALKRFAEGFKARWMAQTYCEPAYAVADCGHVQASL